MFCCLGRECECLQVEEVTLRSETIFESLIWALCISASGVWFVSCAKRSLFILTDTTWKEDYASCVCG